MLLVFSYGCINIRAKLALGANDIFLMPPNNWLMRSDIIGSVFVLSVPAFIKVLLVFYSMLGATALRQPLHVDHGFAHVITLLHGTDGFLMIWQLV